MIKKIGLLWILLLYYNRILLQEEYLSEFFIIPRFAHTTFQAPQGMRIGSTWMKNVFS